MQGALPSNDGAMDRRKAQNHAVNYDKDKVDGVTLALLFLTLHDGARAWKDWIGRC